MRWMRLASCMAAGIIGVAGQTAPADDAVSFERDVAPVFARRCLSCHNDAERKGELSLQTAADLRENFYVEAGDPEASHLVAVVTPEDGKARMPKNGDPLEAEEVAAIRTWIAAGAKWPERFKVEPARVADTDWWSLEPLARPAVPEPSAEDAALVRTPIDAFILAKLRKQGLAPSPEADRRTLIRRLHFDLVGLPPSPEAVEEFAGDPDPRAYENLVDRLLASPHYGERWARHWLDVVHYGDTHGFDKDKLRPNAWPYRDYVIRSFNGDKPYARFVREQIAGDVLWPGTRDGIVATGMLAAGPFDWVGQIEVRNGTMEKKRVRNLDRDDMVRTVMETFNSVTVGCARCHNHKFDPITQEDYYALQAVFAAVDRADRSYDVSPEVAAKREALLARQAKLEAKRAGLEGKVRELAGPALEEIDRRLAELSKPREGKRPEYGYHSKIEKSQDVAKWVQVDLGEAREITRIVYVGCHDEFAGIGAGFGFPVRYRIEISDDPQFKDDVTRVVDRTAADVPNPGITPQTADVGGRRARYVRVTATKLAPRSNDYIFALAELMVLAGDGENAAAGARVTSLDSIEAPVRWRRANLVDGIYYGAAPAGAVDEIARLQKRRRELLARAVDEPLRREVERTEAELEQVAEQLEELPARGMVFAAATEFGGQGNFKPTGGEPREIYVLNRGSVTSPGERVGPGTLACIEGLPARFDAGPGDEEGQRRAALAAWIVNERNPLTWRSIVNRAWYYHFGRGIVNSPNDFGRMGQRPTHPELLDWLAVWFRDEADGSLKALHKLIVTSRVYRQTSASRADFAERDGGNRFLWRQNRRRLEAEAIRDAVLAVSGKLKRDLYGPGFKPFGFKDDHSPHYKYHEHDPNDPASWRRSIYRFIVRSVPDPFMTTLDCADPSLVTAKRNETITALQALALLNNKFMVEMAEHFARRVEASAEDAEGRIDAAFRLALGRGATREEVETLAPIAREHGLANVCRIVLNMNEFIFVD